MLHASSNRVIGDKLAATEADSATVPPGSAYCDRRFLHRNNKLPTSIVTLGCRDTAPSTHWGLELSDSAKKCQLAFFWQALAP